MTHWLIVSGESGLDPVALAEADLPGFDAPSGPVDVCDVNGDIALGLPWAAALALVRRHNADLDELAATEFTRVTGESLHSSDKSK
jgi:hypothetical protein